MSRLSGIRNIDREILLKLDDKNLIRACSFDKYTWNIVCDDDFLKRRLQKYPNIENYKLKGESWKQFFLRATYYIALMEEDYDYIYHSGNFKKQYKLLKKYILNINSLFVRSAEEDELELVIYCLSKGADIHFDNEIALREASIMGNLQVVKYLIEHGADIHIENDYPLRKASENGNLEVVRYLIDKGADINAWNGYPLMLASINGHLKVVKYLVEHGAIIDKETIHVMREYDRSSKILKYLLEQMKN